MRKLVMVALCGFVAVGMMVGCKSKQPQMSDKPLTGTTGEPQWVAKSGGAFPADAGKALYGVGVASKRMIPDPYLQRKAATQRAREEIAGQLRTFVQACFKDYTAAAFTASMDQGEMSTMTSNVAKTITDETLIGAGVQDSWENPATHDLYVLVKADMDGAVAQLKQKMVEVEKGRLKIAADEAHKELDQIIDKNRKAIGVGGT